MYSFNTLAHTKRIVEEGRRYNWDMYQEEVRERDEVLSGDFQHLFRAYVRGISTDESWDLYQHKWVWDTIHHLSADVLESTTKVYKRPAVRSFRTPVEVDAEQQGEDDGAPTFEPDEVFADILETGLLFDFDLEMQRALNMSLAGIGTVIRPMFDPDMVDEDGAPSEDARLMFQVLTADQFVAVVDEFKPSIIRAIDYTVAQPDGVKRDIYKRYIWDATGEYVHAALSMRGDVMPGFYELGEDNEIVRMMAGDDYPYINDEGVFVLPFTPLRPFAQPDRLFNRTLGSDLFEATLKANLYEQRKEWVLRNAAHKQMLVTGVGAGKINDSLSTPGVPTIVPMSDAGEVSFEVLDLMADPELYTEAIRQLYEIATARRGRGQSTFVRSAQKQSADAIREERLGEYEYNDTLQSFQRPVEESFANHIRMVWNSGKTAQVAEDAEFYIDFGNPFETDPYANMDARLINADRNIESVADIVLDLNPDLSTRDEALEKIRQNRAENRAAKQTTEQEAAVAEATPPPNEGDETAPTLAETAAEQNETVVEAEAETPESAETEAQ